MNRRKKHHNIRKQILSLVMSAAVLAGALRFTTPVRAEDGFYPEIAHEDFSFSEIAMEDISTDGLLALVKEGDAIIGSGEADAADRLYTVYERLIGEFDRLSTVYTKASIDYAHNVHDEATRVQEEATYDVLYDAEDIIFTFLQRAMASDEGKAIEEALTEKERAWVDAYEASTPEDKEDARVENELSNDYNADILKEIEVEVDGTTYTEEDLQDLYNEDYDLYSQVAGELSQASNEEVGHYYKELVELRVEEAARNGYDSYVDYLYETVYRRDYTVEEVERLGSFVKDYFLDLLYAVQVEIYGDAEEETGTYDEEGVILEAIEPYIDKIDPRLTESWDYMRRNDLIDIAYGDGRMDASFTQEIPLYDAAFVFVNEYGSYWDYKTVVHEFGHFNAAFHDEVPSFWRYQGMDVAEVQSQGLEVLFLPYWADLWKDQEEGYRQELRVLEDMLTSVITGLMFNECEMYAYDHPEESLADWNRAFGQIYEDYGYGYLNVDGVAYDWVTIGHLFESPLYYISYATSAMASLGIWMESVQDVEAATDKYMQVTKSSDLYFKEMLSECDLPDVFTEETVLEIRQAFEDEYGLVPYEDYDGTEDDIEDIGEATWEEEIDPEVLPEEWFEEYGLDEELFQDPVVVEEATQAVDSVVRGMLSFAGIYGLIVAGLLVWMLVRDHKKKKERRDHENWYR